MHASPDRDKYVEIFWDNIQEAGRSNFQILKKNMAENYGFKYDLLSILHYGAYAYAKNRGLTTIEPHVSDKKMFHFVLKLCLIFCFVFRTDHLDLK